MYLLASWLLCCARVFAATLLTQCRSGKVTDEVYGQNIMFVANDWHAALLPLLLTARFRCARPTPQRRFCFL